MRERGREGGRKGMVGDDEEEERVGEKGVNWHGRDGQMVGMTLKLVGMFDRSVCVSVGRLSLLVYGLCCWWMEKGLEKKR